MHHLVRLREPYCVYLSEPHELGQGAEDGFDGTLPLGLHVSALWALHPFDVALVLRPKVGDAELLFLCAAAQALPADRAAQTDLLAGPVLLLLGPRTVIVEDLGKGDHLPLGANVMVRRFNILEAPWPSLVGTVRGNEAFKPHALQHRIVLTATVARVRHAVLPYKALPPQAAFQPFHDIGQLLVVLPIGMIGPDVGYHMMCRVHAELGEVVQLPGLPGLDAYPCIGIGGTVMGLVTGVLASLVARTRTLVLVPGPLLVTALYRIEFLLVGGHIPLSLIGPVALALAVRFFPVHGTDVAHLAQVGLQFLFRYFELQSVHARVGLHGGRIDRLRVATYHTPFNAHGQHLGEHFPEHRFREQLARPAYRTVPGKLLVDIIAYEEQDVEPHRTMGDELSVADDVLQIAHQTELEEDHRVDALLPALPIIPLGERI